MFIIGSDRNYGVLSDRDYNDTTHDWKGPCFEAVGDRAKVYDMQDDMQSAFDLYGHRRAVVGDWFIIDYIATNAENCPWASTIIVGQAV